MIGTGRGLLRPAVGAGDPYRTADDVLVPLATAASFGGGDRPGEGSALTVRGAEVSAVKREAGVLELRVFNPADTPTTVELPGRSGWLVDLRGRTLAAFEGEFPLGPHDRRDGAARAELTSSASLPVRRPSPSRSSSSSGSTSARRSQRIVRRGSVPDSLPARTSFHSCTRPMSLTVRGRSGWASMADAPSWTMAVRNSSETSTVPGLATPASRLAMFTTGP